MNPVNLPTGTMLCSENRIGNDVASCLVQLANGGSLLMMIMLVTACSGASVQREQNQTDELSQFVEYAGEPVSSFPMVGGLDNWRSLGHDKLVVWTNLSRAYLLTVQPPCSELPFSTGLALTSTGSTVNRGTDSVLVERGKCQITEIRPIDYRRMQENERQKKADQ
jgi:Family of unknown function (DUF6491)